MACASCLFMSAFQSTLSMRSATRVRGAQSESGGISIHALHEERDTYAAYLNNTTDRFQSTLSMRSATPELLRGGSKEELISIHALHEERDTTALTVDGAAGLISIHALHEERDTGSPSGMLLPYGFQSTLSMRSATPTRSTKPTAMDVFQSTLSMRSATPPRFPA